MPRDIERIERIQETLRSNELDGFICALPAHVLMLSGYWPVIGTSIALVSEAGEIALVVPEDEEALARSGWADHIFTFQPGSLRRMISTSEAAQDSLARAARALSIERGRVGCEMGAASEPASYVGMYLYGATMPGLLNRALPGLKSVPAGPLFDCLGAVKTAPEIERIRTACRIAGSAFLEATRSLRPGLSETAAAALFRLPLSTDDVDIMDRADGFVFCMSGRNGAEAYAAFQRSRAGKTLELGELALVHCNSYMDGFWTDVTRTYCLGAPDDRRQRMYEAVFDARAAALDAIRPGARASEVDKAARDLLQDRGYGREFKNPTGHGVGFTAIDHNAPPRLHPCSPDTLEEGMVCNVEPAIYIEGYGGLRHCDVVVVTRSGAEALTPFQADLEQLIIDPVTGEP
ncbi:MAG TPA: Xaa-Pro peptidase family protein [Armatimonadota bacterium]|nr:Xaa-Pro peptidase family protein [Armatimonadota bacterium]